MRNNSFWCRYRPTLRPKRVIGCLILLSRELVGGLFDLDVQAKARASRGLKDRENVGFLPTTSLTAALFGEVGPPPSRGASASLHPHFFVQEARFLSEDRELGTPQYPRPK